MKTFYRIAVAILIGIMLMLPGCKNGKKELFRWKSIQQEADSLVIALDRELVRCSDPMGWCPMIEKLESIAGEYPDKSQLRARAAYWRAKYYDRCGNGDSLRFWVGKAKVVADSSSYPYDMARLNLLYNSNISDEIINDLIRLQNVRTYAEKTEDKLLLAFSIVNYEHLMARLQETDECRSVYEKADSLYSELGLDHLCIWMKVNIGNSYIREGDSISADSILTNILRLPQIKRDRYIYLKILYNIGRLRKNPENMSEVSAIAKESGNRDLELTSRWLEGKFHHLKGNTEAGDSIYANLMHEWDDCDHFLRADILYDNSYRLEREGKIDSALLLSRRYYAQAETIASFASIRKISNIDSMERFRKYNEDMERKKYRERLFWVLAGLIAVVISILIFNYMRREVRKERNRKMEVSKEVERQSLLVENRNRELTSIGLAMTEKDSVLQTLMDRIGDMENKHRITREEARYLDSIIRMHRGRQQEWDIFKNIYTGLSTDFPDMLRHKYPELTEGDIKMATYIRIGMNTRQIANMLNIRPESVKMNRIRLRKRMHLLPEEKLEDVLSKMSENGRD